MNVSGRRHFGSRRLDADNRDSVNLGEWTVLDRPARSILVSVGWNSLVLMTEESTLNVTQAEANRTVARDELKTRKDEFLRAVALEIPGRAETWAKETAHDQVPVTRGLGAEGVRAFRDSLGIISAKAAEDVAGAAGLMTWPSENINSHPTSHQLFAVVREYLTAKVAAEFVDLFEEQGFEVKGSRPTYTAANKLVSESNHAEEAKALSQALRAVSQATYDWEKAKEADDEATVNELWGED